MKKSYAICKNMLFSTHIDVFKVAWVHYNVNYVALLIIPIKSMICCLIVSVDVIYMYFSL